MPKTKDILSKVWLRRGGDGILSRRVCGGTIAEQLPTEQPLITNRQVDMLVRNHLGELRHVEFQASYEPDFAFRMLEYWVYFRRVYSQATTQCVFYIGSGPLRLPAEFVEGGTSHRFEIINLQDYDADQLLASNDWGDNLWALGAHGDRPVVLQALLAKLTFMGSEEQESAFAELTALSGILKIDELLNQKLKEFPMLTVDLEDNAVVRPLIEKGRLEGRQEGRQEQLLTLLSEKFGQLPEWANDQVHRSSAEQLDLWVRRVLRANSLEETLG